MEFSDARSQTPALVTDESPLIGTVPAEVGFLLVSVGIGGVVLPGVMGTPFLVVGGLMFWPALFERMEIGFRRRFPQCHHWSALQVKRFLADLERRYPSPS
jgi:hypothetical protein